MEEFTFAPEEDIYNNYVKSPVLLYLNIIREMKMTSVGSIIL